MLPPEQRATRVRPAPAVPSAVQEQLERPRVLLVLVVLVRLGRRRALRRGGGARRRARRAALGVVRLDSEAEKLIRPLEVGVLVVHEEQIKPFVWSLEDGIRAHLDALLLLAHRERLGARRYELGDAALVRAALHYLVAEGVHKGVEVHVRCLLSGPEAPRPRQHAGGRWDARRESGAGRQLEGSASAQAAPCHTHADPTWHARHSAHATHRRRAYAGTTWHHGRLDEAAHATRTHATHDGWHADHVHGARGHGADRHGTHASAHRHAASHRHAAHRHAAGRHNWHGHLHRPHRGVGHRHRHLHGARSSRDAHRQQPGGLHRQKLLHGLLRDRPASTGTARARTAAAGRRAILAEGRRLD
mmetsp:Transcript_21886/g.53767  ORF Transcript_21886/g.53767 Transcript_21886/m.53767 type:complete len:360 (+) Transcript_21886:368-1447(+)